MALPFLTARWRNLIVVNYTVDPAILMPLLPPGTELDYFDGKALMSVIAFRFEENKLFGSVPTFPVVNFEELNLRFYVRRKVGEEIRRGVVFVKEVVPSALIAATARILYNEPYEVRPMRHDFSKFDERSGGSLSYQARSGVNEITISATTEGELQRLASNSVEEFILEHYWGYTKRPDGSTSEYRVEHERWQYWRVGSSAITGDLATLYPSKFRPFLAERPHSAFMARGSPVSVYAYRRFLPTCDPGVFPRDDVHGYVLYDGTCGLCSWWVPRMERVLASAGFAIAPLQKPWVSRAIALPADDLLRDIRIFLRDGSVISGADAYLYAIRRMKWLWPISALLSVPGLRWITWQVYKVINRNRFFISKLCPVVSDTTGGTERS